MLLFQGLSLARELEDDMGEAIVSGNIGMAHEMLCNLDSAQEHYTQVRCGLDFEKCYTRFAITYDFQLTF